MSKPLTDNKSKTASVRILKSWRNASVPAMSMDEADSFESRLPALPNNPIKDAIHDGVMTM
jgi:hypothetical protein